MLRLAVVLKRVAGATTTRGILYKDTGVDQALDVAPRGVLRTLGLRGSRLTNLTEFVRAVHAEMEALLSSTRIGVSTRRAILYCTTFPCHNCAKHIIDAGVKRVVYIEPYAKSKIGKHCG